MGNCNHRKYLPMLIEWVESGIVDPRAILTQHENLTRVIDAFKSFDRREASWVRVELAPPKA